MFVPFEYDEYLIWYSEQDRGCVAGDHSGGIDFGEGEHYTWQRLKEVIDDQG